MRTSNSLLIVFLLCLFSCEEDPINFDDIISFQYVAERSVPANNYSTHEIKVKINERTDQGQRNIKFVTDLGTFSDDTKDIEITADTEGNAVAYLKSKEKGTANITASISAYTITKEVKFITPNDIITFIGDEESNAPADNLTSIIVKVKVDNILPSDKNTVTFSTSIGNFSGGEKVINVSPNLDGTAQTSLTSSQAGRGIVTAKVNGFTISKEVVFSAVSVGDIFEFTSDTDTTAPADNLSTVNLKILINKNLPADQRTVTFTSDIGTFSNNLKDINVVANVDGIAQAKLKSSQVGTGVVSAEVNDFVVTKDVEFCPVDVDSIIRLSDQSEDTATADGSSIALISVKVADNLPSELRTIELTTDMGTFSNGKNTHSTVADNNGLATMAIKSNQIGTANINMTHRGFVRTETITFTKAEPNRIRLVIPAFSLKSGFENNMTVETYLEREVGRPNEGFMVEYSATDSTGASIGYFANITASDDIGKSTAIYTAGNTTYRGTITLQAKLNALQAESTIAVVD